MKIPKPMRPAVTQPIGPYADTHSLAWAAQAGTAKLTLEPPKRTHNDSLVSMRSNNWLTALSIL